MFATPEEVNRFLSNLDYWRPPRPPGHPLPLALPSEFARLLSVADGLVASRRVFRIFGLDGDRTLPSCASWNNSNWKRNFGPLAEDVVFVAEDILGDQYGYRDRVGGPEFVKFHCEGGDAQPIREGLDVLMKTLIDPTSTDLVDMDLIEAAFAMGLAAEPDQHFAFTLPLIAGGVYDARNLGVESVELHLGLLGPLSLENRKHRAGASIFRFSS